MKTKLHIALASALAFFSLENSYSYANVINASRHKALCSSYSSFSPCEVFVYNKFRITANLPRDYLDVNANSLLQIDICDPDARCKPLASKNIKYIWHDYLLSPFSSVVDYKIRYISDLNRPRTAIIRYINRSAASKFGKALLASMKDLDSYEKNTKKLLPSDQESHNKEILRPFNW